ncbi:MAG: DUF4332 domain-containing protein [Candidatus Thorarchaeota archaeon]
MREKEFRIYLKHKGKKDTVIERNVKGVQFFELFLQKKANKNNVTETKLKDIDDYVLWLEKEQKKSAKGYLYELMNYFSFTNDKEKYTKTKSLREERTSKTRKKFLIKNMLGIKEEYIEKLNKKGIKSYEDILEAAKTEKLRMKLHQESEIPLIVILDIVKLSDIARVGYVRTKLSRLLVNAGIDSVEKLATWDPNKLREYLRNYIKESHWDGMVPLLGDLTNYVNNAKKLPKIIE